MTRGSSPGAGSRLRGQRPLCRRWLSGRPNRRNLLAHAPQRLRDEVSADYNDMIYAASPGEIEQRRRAFLCSGLWTKCGPNSRRCAAELYRNGNLHIVFKRPDIVAKANKIVADFYGETLADARTTA
jgi:hypothetical protein